MRPVIIVVCISTVLAVVSWTVNNDSWKHANVKLACLEMKHVMEQRGCESLAAVLGHHCWIIYLFVNEQGGCESLAAVLGHLLNKVFWERRGFTNPSWLCSAIQQPRTICIVCSLRVYTTRSCGPRADSSRHTSGHSHENLRVTRLLFMSAHVIGMHAGGKCEKHKE